ncbi:phage replication protein [Limosilactobacillus reuteri subsp. reuteri JCM 1112]|nr:ribosomal replication protein [Lactobacillus phage LR1]AYN56781.1 ribosomal replication protein [Lactobacillus phage LR2]EGC13978.1 DnaD domain protein [Limosilactobacillus reuteri MM4-1A]MCT3209902.1 primosomal replication protein N [Limosilactobacillus reuteri]BAG25293.1 phage replication protein [Limosilactobacillus reuteri subsp. reuteri JCM 1112]
MQVKSRYRNMARVKKIKIKGFTIIDNDIINDPRMHLKALGLFAYMWSKPDDWQFYISEIATHFKDGESAVSSAMKELMELGYLKRTQNRKDGKFSTYDYVLQEIPKPENHSSVPKGDLPKPEKSKSEKPIPENQGLLITDNTNTDLNNTNKVLSDAQHSVKDVFELWQNNWGFPNGIAQQDLTEWTNKYGADLVLHVITYALRRNIASKGADRYLAKTFERYDQQSIKTVEQAKKSEQQHEQQMSREYQQKSGSRKRQPINEPMPEWFKKQQEEQPNKQHYERIDDSGDPMPHD